jgi:hypothetical protein
MAYVIVCSGLFDSEGKLIGPIHAARPEKYLPKYSEQEFVSRPEAIMWIADNHKGQDYDGIIANFEVVSRSA